MIILVDVGKFDFLMLKIFLATITLIRKIDEKSCVRRSEQGPGALCCLTVARPFFLSQKLENPDLFTRRPGDRAWLPASPSFP